MNSVLAVLLWTVVGALAGWAASAIERFSPRFSGGHLRRTNVMVGIGGALLAGALTRGFFGTENDNRITVNLMVALLGSAASLASIALFRHTKADTL